MNSRRSLDNCLIGVLGHDELKQHLELLVTGQGLVIRVFGFVRRLEAVKFLNRFFHVRQNRYSGVASSDEIRLVSTTTIFSFSLATPSLMITLSRYSPALYTSVLP